MRGASSILSWLDKNSTPAPAVLNLQSQHSPWSDRNPYAVSDHLGMPGSLQDGVEHNIHDRLQVAAAMSRTDEMDARNAGSSAYQAVADGRGVASDESGARSAGEERDRDVVDHDDSGTFITEQPVGVLPLDYTNYVPSDTTFPNIRGPNLSKLTKGNDHSPPAPQSSAYMHLQSTTGSVRKYVHCLVLSR